ncbi:hypothetical protein [Mesobacillus zeae]|uniref:hypothetical protein n=1 Tax=Mesobacillus zeae TaxID=1917180 RepID=UPI00115EDBAD|nr:hypothetical protein [Mesobacillus zeae]
MSNPYDGYELFEETSKDGFVYGEISDHFDYDTEDGTTYGDGFIQGACWNKSRCYLASRRQS